MKYSIVANEENWPVSESGGRKSFTFGECSECYGKLTLLFNNNNYDNDYVNIPLFLSEIEYFIKQVEINGNSEWLIGFSPFAYGRYKNGSLFISSRSGTDFDDNIYDASSQDDIVKLKLKISKDIDRFGKIKMG